MFIEYTTNSTSNPKSSSGTNRWFACRFLVAWETLCSQHTIGMLYNRHTAPTIGSVMSATALHCLIMGSKLTLTLQPALNHAWASLFENHHWVRFYLANVPSFTMKRRIFIFLGPTSALPMAPERRKWCILKGANCHCINKNIVYVHGVWNLSSY